MQTSRIPPRRGGFSVLPLAIVVAVGGVALNGAAFAQDEPESQPQTLEEVTVTGSRIRRDDFSSAQPTTVMDSEYLENIGIINLGQAMVGVPQNVNRTSPTSNAGNNFFNGSTLANLRGLNPFFGSRTLTLVDSRRHVPTNQGDGVDLNFIPTVLIDRIETVTGGASASYGSGAIGGVQNILLDRDLDGVKVELDVGTSEEGDGDGSHYGFAFGTDVGEGHFILGIEGEDTKGIFKCASARDWCGQNVATLSNTAWPGDGRPQNLITPNVHEAWNSRTGIFWLPGIGGRVPNDGSIVPGVQVNPAGDGLGDFDPGIGGDAFFAGNTVGGEGEGINDDVVLRSPVERTVLYTSFETQLTDNLGFFVEASYGTTETDTEGGFTNVTYTCIRSDNAFIQPSVTGNTDLLDFVTANDGAFPCFQFDATGTPIPWGVPFHKNWENQVNHGNRTQTDLSRVTFGFDGQFGSSTWTWDAYYQWGESDREQLVHDLVHENRYNYAIDSVIDPATGQPACRSAVDPLATTPTAVANFTSFLGRAVANQSLRIGCQPLNPFGADNMSQEAFEYAFGYIRENTVVTQNMAEFVTSGDVAEGFGAGPLRAAFGLSFRSEGLDNIAAEELGDAVRRDFAIQYGETFAGDVDVIEYFGELDLPFVDQFAMNIAARHSQYENTAGQGTRLPGAKYDYDIDTWKVGATWDVVPSFRVRVSESHDIRAPNHRELYYGQVFTPGSFFGFIAPPFSNNPWTNSPNQDPVSATLFGGERNNVKPEEADTTTVGVVIQPRDTNIRLGLDYFKIDLTGSITPANLSVTLQGCGAGIPEFCDKITDGITTPWADPSVDHFGLPTGGNDSIPCPATCYIDIENYFAETFNAGEYLVRGLDLTFDWLKPLDDGSLLLRLLATRTFEQSVSVVRSPLVEIPPVDIAGTVGATVGFLSDYASAPDVSANVTATWTRGDFSLTGQMRYIDGGVIDRGRIGPDDPAYNPSLPGSVGVNEIDSYEIYMLSGTYNFELSSGNQLQLWGTINNLTNEDPPLIGLGGFGGGIGGTNPIFYDTVGRDYRIGVRLSF